MQIGVAAFGQHDADPAGTAPRVEHAETSLHTVAQLVRPGGVLITTVRPGYFDTTDYAEVSASLGAGPAADLLVEFDDLPYTADTNGRYYAYRIN